MKRKHKLLLPAIALLLSATLGLPIAAASDRGEDEREATTTITPVTEDPSAPNRVPLAVITPTTTKATPVVGGIPVTAATQRTTAIIDVTASGNITPSNDGWFGDWFQSILDAITGIGDKFTGLGSTIGGFFTDLGADLTEWFADVGEDMAELGRGISDGLSGLGTLIGGYFDSMWDGLANTLITAFLPLGGRQGMLDLIKLGGGQYINGSLNPAISAMYDVFEVFGIAIMLLCFCFAVASGCYTTEISAKNSIVQPLIGMVIALAAFTLSEKVMSAMFTISMNLTAKVAEAGMNSSMDMYIDSILTQGSIWDQLGYAVLNSILQLVLMLNVAKLALMQTIAPLFIGFASGQGTRRFMLNLVKEYGKCCLMPPVTAAYVIITFTISDSTWGMFSSIVIGFSIFTVGGKLLDKLLS